MIPLGDLPQCFQGIVPAIVATCARDGTPNVTYVSHVYYVDDRRVALSRQFLNKTSQNIGENPYACVQLMNPVTLDVYELDLRYDHSETTGPLFDRMALRIDAIASHTGMAGVFKLIAADVYEVVEARAVAEAIAPAPPATSAEDAPASLRTELRALQVVSQRVSAASDLEGLLASLLGALDEELGFEHSLALLLDETGQTLYTVASYGYEDDGIGAEIAVGEGLIGTVAREQTILRLADVDGDMRYGRAIRREVRSALGGGSLRREIPLPGLSDARSHLAIPLRFADRPLGVLAVESRDPLAFEAWHEAFLGVIAGQAAASIAHAMLRDDDAVAPPRTAGGAREAPPAGKRLRTFSYYGADDCVFVDGEYLIRNVPGRILWRLLRSYADEHRVEFSNRELRLDRSLGLPSLRDNLESRLILLRKRLALRCPDLRMVATRRGQFRLEVDCVLDLVEKVA